MMTIPEGFRVLAESRYYILGHLYEEGYLIKRGGKELIHIGFCYWRPGSGGNR